LSHFTTGKSTGTSFTTIADETVSSTTATNTTPKMSAVETTVEDFYSLTD